jgi:hypothetical protein
MRVRSRLDPSPLRVVRDRYCFLEAFGTLFCHPWIDGSTSWPTEGSWKAGKLTHDKDAGRELPYLHFMVWKGGHEGRFGGGQ